MRLIRNVKRISVALGVCLVLSSCASTSSSTGDKTPATTNLTTHAATGAPILVGFHSIQAETDVTKAFLAGVRYVNTILGGIHGRPLKVIQCLTDGSPEKSIDCANQFVDAHVVMAVQGVDNGADAMVPILKGAGIPEFGEIPLGPGLSADIGNAFFIGGPLQADAFVSLLSLKQQGASTIRVFLPNLPGLQALQDPVFAGAAAKLGVDAKVIYYDPTNPNWTALVDTARSQNADGIAMGASLEPACTGMMTAIVQTQYTGKVLAAGCTDFVSALGAQKTTDTLITVGGYSPSLLNGAPADVTSRVKRYSTWMTQQGLAAIMDRQLALLGFAAPVDVASILDQVHGGITSKSLISGAKRAHGSMFFGGQYNCDGSQWPGTNSCSATAMTAALQADGRFKVVSRGFLDLSPYKPTG